MELGAIERLLADRLGFDVETVGRPAVVAVVRECMVDAGTHDLSAYAAALIADDEHWQAFVDRLVVPETWFFRDRAPFEVVAEVCKHRHALGQPLRVLSVPCSTGEEPYSLAMTLLDAGAPPDTFVIDAVDVSRRALALAAVARFRARSFRGDDAATRARCFDLETDPQTGGPAWTLHERVRRLVRFQQANLLDPHVLHDGSSYDIVFCRNLLIYLHDDARARAMTTLGRLLAAGGLLVVGHAEAAIARAHGFATTGAAGAFAFTKGPALPAPRRGVDGKRPAVPRHPAGPVASRPALPHDRPADVTPRVASLDEVKRLGDAGFVDDALSLCHDHIRDVPDSAEGYFLLGVLHDAIGQNEQAVRALRRALYLAPDHREALLHLASKQEASGDRPGAALLRARASRIAHVSSAE